MKKWILHILLVGVLGILAASCSQEADDPTVDSRGEKEKVLIRFTIALDEPKAASRTSWDGYDPDSGKKGEVGSVAENRIDPNTVQVLIYDMNGTLMGELKEVTVNPADNDANNNQHLYDLTGAFEADADQVAALDFKLMVFANATRMTNLNDIASLQYEYAEGANIPMWGIATFEDVNLSESISVGTATNVGNIYMLRSMAKIEVSLSKESIAGYTLTSATLNKAMKNGIVMPKLRKPDATADASIKDLVATTALGIDEVFNPLTGAPRTNARFTERDDDTFYIYVPEYDVATEDDALQITLDFGDGNPKSFKHGLYSDGGYQNAWNVVRNHYYKYEVTVNSGEDLEIIITIKAWNKRKFAYPSQGIQGLPDATTSSTN